MKSTSLGELEQQTMDIVWEQGNCSAREVLTSLEKNKRLAYTTIATILQRLFDKGLLTRKESKLGYVYSPKLSKEKYTQNVARVFLKKFISSFGDTAISSFVESIDNLPKEKKEYFVQLLEKNEKNK